MPHRFYINSTLQVGKPCTGTTELAHYLTNVLRVNQGQSLTLFNGDGCEYPATVAVLNKKSVSFEVHSQLELTVESPLYCHLGQAISKGDRMELAIQKAVELGVSEITPIITERCNVKLSDERWQKKQMQWQKVVINACEQSGRNKLPPVHPVTTLSHWLSTRTSAHNLVLAPKGNHVVRSIPYSQQGYRLLIGPEGGLTPQEIYSCVQLEYTDVQLGRRVLRTETAAMAALTALQLTFGDFS